MTQKVFDFDNKKKEEARSKEAKVESFALHVHFSCGDLNLIADAKCNKGFRQHLGEINSHLPSVMSDDGLTTAH